MSVSIAEYFGQRTDIDSPTIIPIADDSEVSCPFMNAKCIKLAASNKPVCSVRKTDGTLWIVCRHRLCATPKNIPLATYQREKLLEVAKTIFSPKISANKVLIRREVSMYVAGSSSYKADFIMINHDPAVVSHGPRKVVLEMQGGGETSNTGHITAHIEKWERSRARTNAMLRLPAQAVGTLETNAWRRQQEQFLIKGRIAMQTGSGCGMVFCVGAPLYDYLSSRISGSSLRNLRDHNWTLALVGFKENASQRPSSGPIPLVIDENRILFTDYQTFVRAITDQGQPCPEAFTGDFEILSGGTANVS